MNITISSITTFLKGLLTKVKNFSLQTVFSKQFTVSALIAALIADILMKGQPFGIVSYIIGLTKSLTEKGTVGPDTLLIVLIAVLILKK